MRTDNALERFTHWWPLYGLLAFSVWPFLLAALAGYAIFQKYADSDGRKHFFAKMNSVHWIQFFAAWLSPFYLFAIATYVEFHFLTFVVHKTVGI